jgi:branched-chain amino acid transport system ATP-binding protein
LTALPAYLHPDRALAPTLVEEVFERIAQARKMGTPVLLVEQNASMALSVADRDYILETGSVTLEGQASELASMEKVKAAYLGGYSRST